MRNFTVLFIALIFASLNTGEATAYEHKHCGGHNIKIGATTLRYSTTSFATAAYRNALKEAVNRLNDNPSKHNYGIGPDSGGVSHGNNVSEIWGSKSITAPAVAYPKISCYWFFGWHYGIKAVDIVFNYKSPWRWTTSHSKSAIWNYGPSGSTKRPIQTTALHELGHGLYLGHENDEYNIMGQDFTHIHVNGGTARAYFGEDAADGAVHLFGLRTPLRRDLGVVHWKYNGASGEYSKHRKTAIYNTSGFTLPSVTINNEKHYRVSKGQKIRVEFTYENMGCCTQASVPVGFYVSSNSWITTFDTRVGGRWLTLSRDNVYTRKDTITLPTWLVSGKKYWVGAIIDENNAIAEKTEWNNATYIPIRVN